MAAGYYLGLDIGTTAVKAAVFDSEGRALGIGAAEYTLETPVPDIVELDAEEYWRSSCDAMARAVAAARIEPDRIAAMSITGQAETLIVTDSAGRPLRKAIVWLDNRAKTEAADILREFGAEELFAFSGQTEMLPCWPAAKILWYRRHQPELFATTARYLMVEDYIYFRLSGTFATCRGLLPSTLYFDIRTGEYHRAMLEFLHLRPEQLPPLRDSGEPMGRTAPNASVVPAGVTVAAAPLDHVCGNLGSGCVEPGMISATTGCTMAVCAAFPRLVYDPQRRLSTYLGFAPGTCVLLPWAPSAGMLLRYFRDEFAGGMDYAALDAAAEEVAPGSEGLLLLPHCAGAVSPVCNPAARGVAYGVTLAHKRAHWARAIMESVAYLLRDNILALRQLGADITSVRALGGAARSGLWLRIMADVLDMPVSVTACEEATALGAAILGAAAAGDFPDPAAAARQLVRVARQTTPGADSGRYQELFQRYQELNSLLLPTFGNR